MSETPDEQQIEAARFFSFVDSTLLKNRAVTLFGEVTQDVSRRICERLLALAYEGDDPITMFVCSPGGHVESGDAIFDIMQFIDVPVRTVGAGWVGSIATHVFLAPDRAQRFSLPNTRYLIHQPAGGFGGDASDIEIHAREIIKTRERINQIIADRTGQTIERVAHDTERDFWMSAEESMDYGIVGKIISSVGELG